MSFSVVIATMKILQRHRKCHWGAPFLRVTRRRSAFVPVRPAPRSACSPQCPSVLLKNTLPTASRCQVSPDGNRSSASSSRFPETGLIVTRLHWKNLGTLHAADPQACPSPVGWAWSANSGSPGARRAEPGGAVSHSAQM